MYYFTNMGFFGGLSMLIFWGAFIWLIVWLIKQNDNSHVKKPLDIAEKRYAQGEITKKEFEEIKKNIR